MDSWLISNLKGTESDIDILGTTISTVDGSLSGYGEKLRKYQLDFLMSGLTYQLVYRDECPQCVVCGEVFAYSSLNTRNLCMHLTTKYVFLASKLIQFFERKLLEICKHSTVSLMRTASLLRQKRFWPLSRSHT
jgi:hypothetical protein